MKDGRVLTGDFLCIDKQGNLILGNTYQQATRQVFRFFRQAKAPHVMDTHKIAQNWVLDIAMTTSVMEPFDTRVLRKLRMCLSWCGFVFAAKMSCQVKG